MLYFLKYYNVKLHINIKYFGETLEGTGQVKTTGKRPLRNEPTIRSIVNKKPVNEFVKTHLLAIRVYVPDSLFIYNLYKILLINIYFNIKLQHLILVQMFHNEYDFDQHLMLLILQ